MQKESEKETYDMNDEKLSQPEPTEQWLVFTLHVT